MPNNILVIEDEPALSSAIQKKLGRENFQVTTVATFEDAKKALYGPARFSAIWLDHTLVGEHSGLDLVRMIKGNGPDLKKIPIFVVSNLTDVDDIRSYLKLGITEFYLKSNHQMKEIINDIKKELHLGAGAAA